MKKYLLLAALTLAYLSPKAQSIPRAPATPDANLSTRLRAVEDRIALKELVDRLSILADQKDTPAQMLLFTEDATFESYANGQRISTRKGRQQIGEAFATFMKDFSIVSHHNGQYTVAITGDKATGVLSCFITLIGAEKGQQVSHTSGAYYRDEYVRVQDRWLVAKRTFTFVWQDKKVLE